MGSVVVHAGKPEDKKEKGGDKADDKVRAITLTGSCMQTFPNPFHLSQKSASMLFCQQSKGTFTGSHYYLALYRFKAIEKDDLDFQLRSKSLFYNFMNMETCCLQCVLLN